MDAVLKVANNPVMTILAIVLVGLVVIAAVIFGLRAKKFSLENGVLTEDEIKKAVKTGAIGTVGPAIAVVLVAIGMITQLGSAITFMRVGIIGSEYTCA